MRRLLTSLNLLVGLFWFMGVGTVHVLAQQKLTVEQRMAKAREAKAQKRTNKATGQMNVSQPQKATAADYRAPVDKVLKGPNGEVVRTGERGAKYYINKNGNKTYLSSNQ